MVADIISGLSVIGIAVLMFPLFRGSDRPLPPAYLVLKFIEGVLMIVAGIGALAISTIFKLIGRPQAFLDYFLILIITNEVFLAVWLFIKGFNTDG